MKTQSIPLTTFLALAVMLGRRCQAAAIGLINLMTTWPATNPDSESGLPRTAA
ncbi:MAG: hypothetical protein HY298_05335 [Verrucomicrobia bacterium]|nr:hypothetical protein [Verrucomicrobiota bacterium]